MFFLVKSVSLSPKGAPCELSLPSLFGEPNPIFVLQHIKVGLSFDSNAFSIAPISSSGEWPFTFFTTFQLYDSNLLTVSSVNQPST